MENNRTLYERLSGGYTAEEHRRQMKNLPKRELNIHGALDMVGAVDFLPPVSSGADLLNAALYEAKGDRTNSLLSLAAAIPGIGIGAALKKLTRPRNQLRAATGYANSYEGWFKNLNDYSIQNPGQVNFKKVTKDIQDNPFSSNTKEFYEWMQDYSRQNFGDFVTVPKASVAGSKKVKGKNPSQLDTKRTPDKKKETLQSRLREKEYQEIRSEEVGRGARGQAVTKRKDY